VCADPQNRARLEQEAARMRRENAGLRRLRAAVQASWRRRQQKAAAMRVAA
jgi:hypothetical protein